MEWRFSLWLWFSIIGDWLSLSTMPPACSVSVDFSAALTDKQDTHRSWLMLCLHTTSCEYNLTGILTGYSSVQSKHTIMQRKLNNKTLYNNSATLIFLMWKCRKEVIGCSWCLLEPLQHYNINIVTKPAWSAPGSSSGSPRRDNGVVGAATSFTAGHISWAGCPH